MTKSFLEKNIFWPKIAKGPPLGFFYPKHFLSHILIYRSFSGAEFDSESKYGLRFGRDLMVFILWQKNYCGVYWQKNFLSQFCWDIVFL